MSCNIQVLREFSDAFGVPGYEAEVRSLFRKYAPEQVNIDYDNLGSIIISRTEGPKQPVVMLAAHMDEIGFVVTQITVEGFIRFEPLGRWRENTLLAQQFIIRGKKGDVWGLIGSKPPHAGEDDGKQKTTSDMFIDIGASSSRQVREEFGLREGDPIAPYVPSRVLSDPNMVAGKAWDNRAGCALLSETFRRLGDADNKVVAVGTVQEEVGRRGAVTSVSKVNPDVALVFEGILAGDHPGIDRVKVPTALGKGPTIVFYDESTYPNRRLLDLVIEVAEQKQIPYQLVPARGGNDAGIIQLHSSGVPTIVLGVPTRYIHSHVGIMDSRDLELAVQLTTEVIKRLDASTVEWIKAWARE